MINTYDETNILLERRNLKMSKIDFKKINIFGNMDMSPEAIEVRMINFHKEDQENLENMSYWLPKIQSSSTKDNSILRIPKTKIIPLNYEMWKWLRSDKYTPEKIHEFNILLSNGLDNFMENETLFMKTGTFSNKFKFSDTAVSNRNNIGEQLLDIYYASMMVGADNSSEVVVREMVVDKENRLRIYDGMPLHTEFRVFYDYDAKEVIGVANYWHPEVMEKGLRNDDLVNYQIEKENIVSDFNQYKLIIAEEVKFFMEGVTELNGRWSIDIMKNDTDFWLIDMARMERSALTQHIEQI
jgi:hypothetical protein